MEEKKEPGSFEIKDKRRFVVDAAGEAQGAAEEKTAGSDEQGPAFASPREAEAAAEARRRPLPEIDFSTFVLSLSSSALLHLGLMKNPITGKTERNLSLAKQTIDIIVMLRDKTKNNLSTDEARLIEHLIADLQLNYVNEIRK